MLETSPCSRALVAPPMQGICVQTVAYNSLGAKYSTVAA